MFVQRLDHVGITVSDLEGAVSFFAALGLEEEVRTVVEGEFIDTVTGIAGACTEIVMMRVPGSPAGAAMVELASFVRPQAVAGPPDPPATMLGMRSIALEVEDLRALVDHVANLGYDRVAGIGEYEGAWRMTYVRGPEGIIVALAQRLG